MMSAVLERGDLGLIAQRLVVAESDSQPPRASTPCLSGRRTSRRINTIYCTRGSALLPFRVSAQDQGFVPALYLEKDLGT